MATKVHASSDHHAHSGRGMSREVDAAYATPHSRPHWESVTWESMHSASYRPGVPQGTSAAMLAATTTIGCQRASALCESILKRAIEDHLVPHDPADELASALLERIRAERGSDDPAAPHTVIS